MCLWEVDGYAPRLQLLLSVLLSVSTLERTFFEAAAAGHVQDSFHLVLPLVVS